MGVYKCDFKGGDIRHHPTSRNFTVIVSLEPKKKDRKYSFLALYFYLMADYPKLIFAPLFAPSLFVQ